MASIVVSVFVSLDGVMEAPGGEPNFAHTGWVMRFQDDIQVNHKCDEVLAADALLLGRVTYESFAGAWPHILGAFGDKMNAMPKYVASTTLRDPEWNNTTVLTGDAMAAVARLRESPGGEILVNGSRTLVDALRRHDLIDEYRLMVFPIVLGSGNRLFQDTDDAAELRLNGARPFPNGAVELTYRPADRPA